MAKIRNLLLDEQPAIFSPSVAVAFGSVAQAVILQMLNFFLSQENSGIEEKGHRWIYNSYPEWQKKMPYYSVDEIRNAFQKLEASGAVKSCQPFVAKWNRSKAYRIDHAKFQEIMRDAGK